MRAPSRKQLYVGLATIALVMLAALAVRSLRPLQPGVEAFAAAPTEDDCRVLEVVARESFAAGAPLVVTDPRNASRCDWLAKTPFLRVHARRSWDARCAGLPKLSCAHVSLGKPRYSLFRRSARVDVSFVGGVLVGRGESCVLEKLSGRWVLRSCGASWLA
jgi:hypothetical protein